MVTFKNLGKDTRPEYDFSDAIKNPYVSNSIKTVNQEDMTSEDDLKKEDMKHLTSMEIC